jgi:hypothetical protein
MYGVQKPEDALARPAACERQEGASMIGPFVLAGLIRACEPDLPAQIVPAQIGVVMTETAARLRWNPSDASLTRAYQPSAWAIHDDNTDATYCVSGFSCPSTFDGVVSLAATMIARDRVRYGSKDRGVDLGLAQINSGNLAEQGVTIPEVLHACSNLSVSGRMLSSTFTDERQHYSEPVALDRTLQAYNSGLPYGDSIYTENVLRAASSQYAHVTMSALAGAATPVRLTASVPGMRNLMPARTFAHRSDPRRLAPPPRTQFAGAGVNVFTHRNSSEDFAATHKPNNNGGPH